MRARQRVQSYGRRCTIAWEPDSSGHDTVGHEQGTGQDTVEQLKQRIDVELLMVDVQLAGDCWTAHHRPTLRRWSVAEVAAAEFTDGKRPLPRRRASAPSGRLVWAWSDRR